MVCLHKSAEYSFASDNYAGVHPRILAALAEANGGHQPAYGADVYTQALQARLCAMLGQQAQVFPVFNGTGANVLALQALLPRWGAVICAQTAHIHCDEGVAPEYMGGVKLLTVDTPDGKLTPQRVAQQAWGWGNEHRAQPGAVYISESTELGTVYTAAEIRALADFCHAHDMKLYVDGARLANALAYLNVDLKTLLVDTGVDVFSLGGTKNGLMMGECLVTLNPQLATAMPYLRKINGQLGSKMRFVSAQFLAWLEGDLWLDLARHSNAMTQRLFEAIGHLPGVRITQTPQANALFVCLPQNAIASLHRLIHFYDWHEHTGEVRWMTAFDTTVEQVDAFAKAIRDALVADPT